MPSKFTQAVTEVYNLAINSVSKGQQLSLLDWLKVLVNTLDGANPLVEAAMNSNEFSLLVTEFETLVESKILPNLVSTGTGWLSKLEAAVEKNVFSAGFVHLVEPVLLSHKAKIEAVKAVAANTVAANPMSAAKP